MARVRVTLNSAGVRELLNSEGVKADLRARGEAVKAAAESSGAEDVTITEDTHGVRPVVHVGSNADDAMSRESKTRDLGKAIDAARGTG